MWGYNPGTLYDEAIAPDERLLAWRCMTLFWAIGVILLLGAFDKLHIDRTRKIVATALLGLGFFQLDQTIGAHYLYRIDREVLAEKYVSNHPCAALASIA